MAKKKISKGAKAAISAAVHAATNPMNFVQKKKKKASSSNTKAKSKLRAMYEKASTKRK